MERTQVLIERRDAVVKIIINRPEKRNSISIAAVRELIDAFEELRSDNSISVVLTTGAGDDAYCAGRDLTEFTTDFSKRESYDRRSEPAERAQRGQSQVARVNGGFPSQAGTESILKVSQEWKLVRTTRKSPIFRAGEFPHCPTLIGRVVHNGCAPPATGRASAQIQESGRASTACHREAADPSRDAQSER